MAELKTLRNLIDIKENRDKFDRILENYINDGWDILSPLVMNGDYAVIILIRDKIQSHTSYDLH
jgi:hypothetical protein